MSHRKNSIDPGIPGPIRGKKLPRRRKFEASIETKSGIAVRSEYERICADYMHDRGIRFQYEPLMLIGGKQFRPDFYLPEHDLFVEICGYVHMPHYRSRMRHKEGIYRRNGLKALFVEHDGKGSLADKLGKALAEHTGASRT